MLNDVVEIRKVVQAALIAIHSRVFYESAPPNATYPYLVYNLPNSNFDGANSGRFMLEVDGWDRSADTAALELLMFKANGALDNLVKNPDSSLTIRILLENKLNLADTEALIIRRKYNYQVRTVQRRG